jgi:hypothetical protein
MANIQTNSNFYYLNGELITPLSEFVLVVANDFSNTRPNKFNIEQNTNVTYSNIICKGTVNFLKTNDAYDFFKKAKGEQYFSFTKDGMLYSGVFIVDKVYEDNSSPYINVSFVQKDNSSVDISTIGGGSGEGQPTNIASTTLDVGGAGYSRTINLKPTDIATLAQVANKQNYIPFFAND